MMCSDSDAQIGRSDWTRRMMMNMPATNISPSSTTAPPTSASSPSSAAAAKAAVTQQQPSQQQDHRPAGPLRCPRCDSANTKFCYYNNYSLSQPRHFCKACKRYWTRGGTLRNVPVGGGCRKNKRVKKQHHQPNTTTTAKASATVTINSDPLPPPSPPPPTSSDLSSFFYGLTTSDMNMNLGSTATAAYDALGLGGLIPSNQLMNTNLADLQQQPSSSSSSFLHHHNEQYPSSFGSQAASLLMSSLKQQPKKAEDQYGQSLLPDDSSSANLGFLKDVEVEGDHSNLNHLISNNIGTEWQAGGYPLFEANVNGVTDTSFLYWNPAMGGTAGWPDASNSSVAPLI